VSSTRAKRHAEPANELAVVHVTDEVNHALAGHSGIHYESPPQSREQAVALAWVLLGYTRAELDGAEPWTCPTAGGRRTVALKAAAGSGH
jgi:hypothetical protein